MKSSAMVAIVAMLLLMPVFVSGSAPQNIPLDDGSYLIDADGFVISISSESPSLSFYRHNSSEAVFSISYVSLVLYSGSVENPEYISDLSSSLWETTIYNSTEEDGTIRTVVSMSSTIDMDGETAIDGWGTLTFQFLILTAGEKAQLGISMNIDGMKPVSSCSHMALIQSVYGDATFIPESNELIVSDTLYYRWDPTATIDTGSHREERDVSATYSDSSLALIYPYSQDMVGIMHVSGKVDLGEALVIRDYFSDILGYSLGALMGIGLFGMNYAVRGKKKRSPFDMDSPIYRK